MSDKTAKTTKADLFKMLAEAVRNTPGATPIEPPADAQPAAKPKTRPAPKSVVRTKNTRASSGRKKRGRR